jgi:hypothetical protein
MVPSWRHALWAIVVLGGRIGSRISLPSSCGVVVVDAWEWSDLVRGHGVVWGGSSNDASSLAASPTTPLSIQQVSEMRVRDIKRRLTRNHGYSAEEVARVLDKKELIQALAFEEEKVRLQYEGEARRTLLQQGVLAALVAIFILACWPLFQQAYEVAMVNLVVYTDRKRHEANRCLELQSTLGFVGIAAMAILDVLQLWLTASVLLSWVVTTSPYFFPIPKLTVRPAQFLGPDMAASSMANYGINIGAMLITWGMRFAYGQVERWTGQVLSSAHRQQRRQERARQEQLDSVEERAARKAARKASRLEKQQYQMAAAAAAAAMHRPPPPPPPPEWDQHYGTHQSSRPMSNTFVGSHSKTHQEFVEQLSSDPPPDDFEMESSNDDCNDEVPATALDALD